jgi:hypothetical protein
LGEPEDQVAGITVTGSPRHLATANYAPQHPPPRYSQTRPKAGI